MSFLRKILSGAALVVAGMLLADVAAYAQPSSDDGADEVAAFSLDDELILELEIKGEQRRDTIVAYGRLPEVYLPFGLIGRLLDLAITVGDNGRYASGWILAEDNHLTLKSGEHTYLLGNRTEELPTDGIVAFDGEMYIRPEFLEKLIPVEVTVDLRAQAVGIKTLEEFPFQARKAREERRGLLSSQSKGAQKPKFVRESTPYRLFDVPKADIEVRAISDSPRGARAEGELYLAGDLAKASAELFLSSSTDNGFDAALIELGRNSPDGGLLGPLSATSLAVGDVQTVNQPLGLRSSFGRGFRISNAPLDTQSVFDEIDLRGVLQDGFEVELYRNGILLGSTDRAVNGQYEFLKVPVDFGINAFRLVFYGPQGRQTEEVRTITVGDGRLPKGRFDYDIGVVQNGETVFGVDPANQLRARDTGSWRTIVNAAYGVSSNVTFIGSGSFDQRSRFDQTFVGSFGVRTGAASTGIRLDTAFASAGGFAAVAGVNGQLGNTNITFTHGEYLNGFVDEQRAADGRPLGRATDLNMSASINLGTTFYIPVVARARRLDFASGGEELRASARASARVQQFTLSNSFDFVDFKTSDGSGSRQLLGAFDLSTTRRDEIRARASLEYKIVPEAQLSAVSVSGDWRFRQDSVVQLTAAYRLDGSSLSLGAGAITTFGKTSLALEADYDLERQSHALTLRWGLSLGRSARGFYVDEGSRARLGAVELVAFHDRDADGVRDDDEDVLPDLTFFTPGETAATDSTGHVLLTGLPVDRGTSVQIDVATLPDIALAPPANGFEIVPRRGRTHSIDFPIVSIGEIDGTVFFSSPRGKQAVGGVLLGLTSIDKPDRVVWLRSEADGYFYFEQVPPGAYEISLDAVQSSRLHLCLSTGWKDGVEIPPEGGTRTLELVTERCAD